MELTHEEMESFKVERESRIEKARKNEKSMRFRHAFFPKNPSFWGRYETELGILKRTLGKARASLVKNDRIGFKEALKAVRETVDYFDERRREDSAELAERLMEKKEFAHA